MSNKNMNTKLSVNFTKASTKQNITSGENISTSFGKISKYLDDLGSAAFTNSNSYATSSQGTKADSAVQTIQMNGNTVTKTDGVVDLGTVITAHQNISGKADKSATVSTIAYDTTNKKLTKTINGTTSDVVTTAQLKTDMALSKSDVGLGNVGNFKAVSTVASQGLTDTEKANARTNIGAGTSSFSGSYNDLSNKPTIPAAVAVKGNAETNYRTGNVNLTPANIGAATTSQGTKADSAVQTIQMNGNAVTKTNGVVDLGTVITVHQDISGKADKSATVSTVTYDTTNKKLTKTINGTTTDVVTTAKLKTDMALSKSDVGLSNVGNFKAVSTVASQVLSDTEKSNARTNIGAGTSSFDGNYNSLSNKPTIPTVNNGTLTIQKNGTNVATFTANQSGNSTANIAVPTKVSQLTNDSGYTTNTGTVKQVTAGAGLSGGNITESGTISLANHSADYIQGGYLNIHPETVSTLIPFMHNDIAYLIKRGGSAIVKYDNTTQTVDLTNCFDASPSYWAINPTGITTITIELTLHKVFAWTNRIYIDFGDPAWRAKSIKIEVINTNYTSDVWTQKYFNTNHSSGHCYISFYHVPVGASNAGGGFNKIRFTLSSWATSTDFRIAQIGVYNYGSYGLRETFLPKDGGNVYGTIYPHNNNVYDLGGTSHYWKNGYFTNINGVAVGSNPKFTDTNTTYSAGTGTTITGTNNAINVAYGTTANTACQGNDSRLSNSRPASDVYSWAKAASKPTYTASEVGAAPASHTQASSTINAMTGYSKPSSTSAITASDTLNQAIGKLEKAVDGAGTPNDGVLTIQQNGTTLGTFSANQAGNTTVNIEAAPALMSWQQLQQKVRNNDMNDISIGDQFVCSYGQDTLTWEVIGKNQDSPVNPQHTYSLTLKLHFQLPYDVLFSQKEAFYYCSSQLKAGNYRFKRQSSDSQWYNFTLRYNVPKGGQLYFKSNFTSISSYSSAIASTPIETVTGTYGSGGSYTDLGTLGSSPIGNLNSYSACTSSNNRYSESIIRQWLNSNAAAGEWWQSLNNWQRKPDIADTRNGFMYGLDSDFIEVLEPTEKITATSNSSDTTSDIFFLLSQTEVYGGEAVSGVPEGQAYTFYTENTSLTSPDTSDDINRITCKRSGIINSYSLRTQSKQVSTTGSITTGITSNTNGIIIACNII